MIPIQYSIQAHHRTKQYTSATHRIHRPRMPQVELTAETLPPPLRRASLSIAFGTVPLTPNYTQIRPGMNAFRLTHPPRIQYIVIFSYQCTCPVPRSRDSSSLSDYQAVSASSFNIECLPHHLPPCGRAVTCHRCTCQPSGWRFHIHPITQQLAAPPASTRINPNQANFHPPKIPVHLLAFQH
jgi:hypothetical protein